MFYNDNKDLETLMEGIMECDIRRKKKNGIKTTNKTAS